jgi:hypothetical protein
MTIAIENHPVQTCTTCGRDTINQSPKPICGKCTGTFGQSHVIPEHDRPTLNWDVVTTRNWFENTMMGGPE